MSRMHPGLPGATVRHSNEVFTDPDGTKRAGVHITVGPELFEQYRIGYRCILCQTVQDEPFPEVCKEVYKDRPHSEPCECSGCGCFFRMRDKQMDRIAYEYQGEVSLWPEQDVDWEREDFIRRTGAWLPGDE